jgi:hypothetical protein
VTENTANAVSRVNELGLSSVVQIVQQSSDENLECLRQLLREAAETPTPYLERMIGGGTGAVLYYTGDEMDAELVDLRQRLQARGYGFC